MTDVFEVPRFLEQDWKDWWTINDYIAQGKSHTYAPKQTIQHSWEGDFTGWMGNGNKRQKHTSKQTSKQDITNGHPLTKHPNNTGCEITTYEPISSFLTDAQIHILSTHHGLSSGASAAATTTHERAAEILDCITDTESLFDTREALFHLESLLAAARLACQWDGGPGPAGARTHNTELRAMVAAACATLGPLLAELPALWEAVAADGRFAVFWRDLEGARTAAGGLLTPEVRERMRWVVESREV